MSTIEITAREEISLGDAKCIITQFDDGERYLLTFGTLPTSWQIHLDQDGIDQLHAVFSKFAEDAA